ncbi:MAG: hypothetical protein ACRDMZ_03970 [Solirubrobacteraceae bacterium]
MPATSLKSAVAVALAAFAVGAAPAAASHQALDAPLTATPCKLDTSPSYPSCGTVPMVVAQLVPEPAYTATPCKLDTSPRYPSCGARP